MKRSSDRGGKSTCETTSMPEENHSATAASDATTVAKPLASARKGARTRTNGGGDGPPEPPEVSIAISSPAANAPIVGNYPGVTVSVNGTFTAANVTATPTISVSLGGSPEAATVDTTTGTWSYSGTTKVGGPITIKASIDGRGAHSSAHASDSRSVLVINKLPTLPINSPGNYSQFKATVQVPSVPFKVASVPFNGTLSDPPGFGFGQNPITGFVQPVSWSGDWTVAGIPNSGPVNSPDNWATWNFTIQVPPGAHTVTFTCTDIGGMQAVVPWHVVVQLPSINKTTGRDYLKALLEFATQTANPADESSRIVVANPGRTAAPNGQNLVDADLVEAFYQSFPDLTLEPDVNKAIANKATEPVNQIRLVVEVLRKYTTAPSDPIAYWKCNEGSGTTAADSSGSGLNGTLVNASWAPGQPGRQALQLNGTNAYVQVGNPPQLTMTAALTVAAWVNPSGPGSDSTYGGIIVSKEAEYAVSRDPQGNINWAFANAQPGWKWTNTGSTIPLNQWTHVAITYDNGLVNSYINGALVHSYSANGLIGSTDPNHQDFRIGGRQVGTQFFQGLIDEVMMFARALNAREIAYLAGQLTPAVDDASYRQAAYLSLLNQVGTSYDQLRLARGASRSDRLALAAQLGIDPDHLDALCQDASSISEQTIEKIFGLADTTRNSLSDGAKISDVSRSLVQWNFDGVDPGRNTDADGIVYISLQAKTQTVTVYSDSARRVLVATGAPIQPNPTVLQLVYVPLAPVNNSGLAGALLANFTVDANDIKIAAAANLLTWQMQHLRMLWAAQDFPQPPALLLIAPNSVQPGQNNVQVTITGQSTNFLQGTTIVNFGAGVAVASLTVHSSTSVIAVLNIDRAAQAGGRNLTVTTNLEVVTLTNALVVARASAPILIQVSPGAAPAAGMNVTVAITGQSTHFVQGTTVGAFGGGINVIRLTVNSPTSATAVFNIDPAAALGSRDVTLTTNAEVATLTGGFVVNAAAPAPPPIIDPDLLTDRDFKNANNNDNAYALYTNRQSVVGNWIQTLKGLRASGSGNNLDAVLQEFLIDSNHVSGYAAKDVVALDQSRKQGNDISPYLAALNLPVNAFNYLVKICLIFTTAKPSRLLESEWNDVYSILAQSQKVGQFAAWRAIENSPAYNLTLSLDWFQLNANDFQPLAWRGTPAARLAWQAVLQGRNNQKQAIIQDLKAAVDATEQACLPPLRDAIGKTVQVPANAQFVPLPNDLPQTDWLSQRFLINVGINGSQKTTRLDQAVTTLQTLFFVLRNGTTIPELGYWNLNRDTADLDAEWAWMGTYSAWQAVMAVFIFPQNVLLPYMREGSNRASPTQAFLDMLTETTNSAPLSPAQARKIAGDYLANLKQGPDAPSPSLPPELTAFVNDPTKDPAMALSDQIAASKLPQRAATLQTWWNNYNGTADLGLRQAYLNYLAEIFYFVPLHLAQQLQQAGQFIAALDWYQTIYAYRLLAQQPPPVITSLTAANNSNGSLSLNQAFYVVATATNQWGESTGSAEKELTISSGNNSINGQVTLPPAATGGWAYYTLAGGVPGSEQLRVPINSNGAFTILSATGGSSVSPPSPKIWYGLVGEEGLYTTYDRSPTWLVDGSLNPHDLVVFGANPGTSGRASAYTRFTLISLARCFLAFADSEFSRSSSESIANATNLYLTALSLLASPEIEDSVLPNDPNPLVRSLTLHAALNLKKIQRGFNIAGVLEQATTASPDGSSSFQPSQYGYQVLIDRAKQLVSLAQQVEGSFLAALEKTDTEAYNRLKANQDLQVANQNVTLQSLVVTEAQANVTLAQDQQARAQIQVNHYSDLINSNISGLEQASLDLMTLQVGLQGGAAALYTTAAIAGGISPQGVFSLGSISASDAAQAASSLAQAMGSVASSLSAQANYEEKQKDWQFQLDFGNQEVLIAGQQITIANDHVDVVTQQQTIAALQATNAQNTLDFLTNQKFTNAALYQWMSGVLQGVYSYFLQQATTIARMAQNQLAFERQQPLLNVIQADYWQPPSAGNTSGGTTANSGQPADSKGLTAAELLLEDIYKLDQYAFLTNQRKLQITKTISLAQLDPFAFQQFTETGVLRFATPAALFDADFPGHYLRLIQQVRTSVIALIPPIQGIRATLANTGVSRVTVQNDSVFSEVVVRRDPQEIALSAPMNATGVFQLDPQQQLLLPFQGLGVDTSWEFRMPKAANPFDYSTIADVLVTIDYMAMDSPDYRQQIIRSLDRSFSADRGYSFQQQFADAWYALNNPGQPGQSGTPMAVTFTTQQADFPPNLSNLQIQQLLLHFVPKDGVSFQISVKDLQFTPAGSQTAIDVGGTGQCSGTLSTRRGNAANWVPLISQSPFGQWHLALPDDNPADPNAPRNLIGGGQIIDILFVISYSATRPAWPN